MSFLKKLFGEDEKQPMIQRTLMNIELNDIIMYYEKDYQVIAVADWVEDGYAWKEYKLKDQKDVFWISAEIDDGELVAGFYKVVDDLKLKLPFPESFVYQGITFKLEEQGNAIGKLKSQLGEENNKCTFYDYISEDEKKYFSIEVYGEEFEMSFGEDLKQSEINILPGG